MTDTTKEQPKLSDTLIALLRATKGKNSMEVHTFESLRKVLGPIYHYEMKIIDMANVVTNCYHELMSEPRFEAGSSRPSDITMRLLKAPLQGIQYRDRKMFAEHTDTLTVEEMYSYIIFEMVSAIHLSRIDWCRSVIWPNEGVQGE